MPAFGHELAATILVEALFSGDEEAARKFGVSTRSIRNWRKRLTHDAHFSAFFQLKKQQAETDWASALTPAIRAGIEFLQRAAQQLDPASPEAAHAAAGALKILTEVAMTREVLNARLAGAGRETNSAS